jgi:hypothetical protein
MQPQEKSAFATSPIADAIDPPPPAEPEILNK